MPRERTDQFFPNETRILSIFPIGGKAGSVVTIEGECKVKADGYQTHFRSEATNEEVPAATTIISQEGRGSPIRFKLHAVVPDFETLTADSSVLVDVTGIETITVSSWINPRTKPQQQKPREPSKSRVVKSEKMQKRRFP